MSVIVRHMRVVMIVCGILNMTMLYAAVAPRAMVQSNFGEAAQGAWVEVVVRNWGALIAIVGGMLVYAAGRPALRPMVLVAAMAGKALFIGLVLSQGGRYLGQQVMVAVVTDTIMIVLFAWYLLAARGASAAAGERRAA
jgi:hypothetical protein